MCCIKRGDGWRYNSHGRVYYRSLHHISQRSFSVLVSERLLLRGSSTRFTTRSRECSPRTGLPTKTQLLWLLFTIRVTIVRDSLRRIASSFTQYCFLASPMFSSEQHSLACLATTLSLSKSNSIHPSVDPSGRTRSQWLTI